jgi:hypothetical protein
LRSALGARATISFRADAVLPEVAAGGLDVAAAADDCGRGAGALALEDGAGAVAVDRDGAEVAGAVL